MEKKKKYAYKIIKTQLGYIFYIVYFKRIRLSIRI